MPWSLLGTRLTISKGAASVRKACAGITLNSSVSGTSVAAGGENESNPTAVWPVDLQALLRDGHSENVEHHLCSTCRPIFLHIIGAYQDHPLYDSATGRAPLESSVTVQGRAQTKLLVQESKLPRNL
jgi:hypothetical protein